MPIKGISDVVRMPRLGKIHLGVKVTELHKSPYPRATDHFVVPPEVAKVFGDKPRELPIMFPSEAPEQFAQQWLRCYSQTQGLVCIGDGQACRRKVDLNTGAMANYETAHWEWRDGLACDPQECPEFLSKRCRKVMNLLILLPDVPGLGVWQIDTSSFWAIVNINSMVEMLKGMVGRCSMIPLTLALGPMEVSPQGQKKKKVNIMYIKKDDIKLVDLARLALLPPVRAILPEPEAEEPPEDLFPTQVLAGEVPAEDETEPLPSPPPETGPKPPGRTASKPKTAEADPWSRFWAKVRDLGLGLEDVRQILGVKQVKDDWVDKGRSLDEALLILEDAAQKARQKPVNPQPKLLE